MPDNKKQAPKTAPYKWDLEKIREMAKRVKKNEDQEKKELIKSECQCHHPLN